MQIKIYTKAYCSYCYAAKNLLTKRGLAFEETELSGNFKAEQEMRDLTGGTTVPQILINGTPIGGFTELVELDTAGQLKAVKTTSNA
jgi:glutaredoxin 3